MKFVDSYVLLTSSFMLTYVYKGKRSPDSVRDSMNVDFTNRDIVSVLLIVVSVDTALQSVRKDPS